MKNLTILIVIIFFVLGCTTPQQTERVVEKVIEYRGQEWVIAGVDQQIYPTPPATASLNEILLEGFKSILSGRELYSAPTVTAQTAEEDFEAGKIYGENSYSSSDSVYKDVIHYIDVGAIVGLKQKLLVNIKFTMTNQADNANAPMVHIRPKGSNEVWKILNPTLTQDHSILIVTDDQGVIEWYHDNGAPYMWNPTSYGWDDIVGYADCYTAMVAINN